MRREIEWMVGWQRDAVGKVFGGGGRIQFRGKLLSMDTIQNCSNINII